MMLCRISTAGASATEPPKHPAGICTLVILSGAVATTRFTRLPLTLDTVVLRSTGRGLPLGVEEGLGVVVVTVSSSAAVEVLVVVAAASHRWYTGGNCAYATSHCQLYFAATYAYHWNDVACKRCIIHMNNRCMHVLVSRECG